MKPTALELEIHGQNELKKLAKYALIKLIQLLNLYIDKKLFTSKGLTTKAQQDINILELLKDFKLTPLTKGFVSLHFNYLTFSYQSLTLKIGICLNGGSYDVTPKTAYCQYFDQTFYIGKMSEKDGTILKEVDSIDKLIANYELNMLTSVERELLLIKEWKEAKAQIETIEKKISVPKDTYKYM